jgi:lipopolysaccharide transport system ATP-binding protein
LSGRDNVFLNGAILGMSRAETKKKFDEIVEFSGVREFIDIPVKRYSSGMQVRLAFAVAAHLDPEVLLLDEVLAVGDAAFQAKCHARVHEIARAGRTVLFVSHDVNSVVRLCENAIVLRKGRVAYAGPAEEAAQQYLMSGQEALNMWRRTDPRSPVTIGGVAVRGEDGSRSIGIGAPLQIEVDLDARVPTRMRDLRIELSIKHPTGDQYVALSTDLDEPGRFDGETIAGRATVVCALDGLPLKPSGYTVGVVLYRHGDAVDEDHRAAEFTLVSAPFFASGIVPSNHPAPVLVQHSWALAKPSSLEADGHSGAAASAVGR